MVRSEKLVSVTKYVLYTGQAPGGVAEENKDQQTMLGNRHVNFMAVC